MVSLHGSQGLLVSFPTTRGEHRAESFQMHVGGPVIVKKFKDLAESHI